MIERARKVLEEIKAIEGECDAMQSSLDEYVAMWNQTIANNRQRCVAARQAILQEYPELKRCG